MLASNILMGALRRAIRSRDQTCRNMNCNL